MTNWSLSGRKWIENAKFDAEFESVEKHAKNIHPIEVIGRKTFAHGNKRKKIHFTRQCVLELNFATINGLEERSC